MYLKRKIYLEAAFVEGGEQFNIRGDRCKVGRQNLYHSEICRGKL